MKGCQVLCSSPSQQTAASLAACKGHRLRSCPVCGTFSQAPATKLNQILPSSIFRMSFSRLSPGVLHGTYTHRGYSSIEGPHRTQDGALTYPRSMGRVLDLLFWQLAGNDLHAFPASQRHFSSRCFLLWLSKRLTTGPYFSFVLFKVQQTNAS